MSAYEQAFATAAAAFGWPDEAPPLTGPTGLLPSRLPVEDAAAATVATALTAAAALQRQSAGHRPRPALRREAVAVAFQSERFVRVDGTDLGAPFAALSGFWPAADGWVRTHANYPWHRDALLATLDSRHRHRRGGPSARRAAGRGHRAPGHGRRRHRCRRTHRGAVASRPRRPRPSCHAVPRGALAPGRARGTDLPAWVRVLDLTRVIAGPVGTRFLAALGADVLRIDPPRLPELPRTGARWLLGKRSALLDLPQRQRPAAPAARRRRRRRARLPPRRACRVRARPRDLGPPAPRPGRGPAVGLGCSRPSGAARFRQHRPGRLRHRDDRVPGDGRAGRDALPAARPRHRLPRRGRRPGRPPRQRSERRHRTCAPSSSPRPPTGCCALPRPQKPPAQAISTQRPG